MSMTMTAERAKMKAWLVATRFNYIRGGVVCDLCGELGGSDLHEHWISRAQAQGNPDLEAAILVSPYNASILCNDCNLHRAETEEGRKLLRKKSIERYGKAEILDWIGHLPFRAPKVKLQFYLEVENL
jgi:hypothetical protein